MLIAQIIEFESWLYIITYIPKTGYFHGKNKNLQGKSSSELLNAKNVAEGNVYLTSPDVGQVTKFNSKM